MLKSCYIVSCHRQLALFPVATCQVFDVISSKGHETTYSTVRGRSFLSKIWWAFMVGNAGLLILLTLVTRQVAPDNTVVLMLKGLCHAILGNFSTDQIVIELT